MNSWEQEFLELAKKEVNAHISERYELRPGITGPTLVCTTCAREISSDLSVRLVDVAEEAAKHELDNHHVTL